MLAAHHHGEGAFFRPSDASLTNGRDAPVWGQKAAAESIGGTLLGENIADQASRRCFALCDPQARPHAYPPAEAELRRHFQVTPPSVHQMILTLERLGLIRRTPRAARSIEVLVAPEHLPVLQREPVKSSVQRY
ncbi:MAG TPA: hypothetical protein VFE10_18570 [Phenylobacterium sp.]|nr:hypothetical protein [Phenylobacterium sp.]